MLPRAADLSFDGTEFFFDFFVRDRCGRPGLYGFAVGDQSGEDLGA